MGVAYSREAEETVDLLIRKNKAHIKRLEEILTSVATKDLDLEQNIIDTDFGKKETKNAVTSSKNTKAALLEAKRVRRAIKENNAEIQRILDAQPVSSFTEEEMRQILIDAGLIIPE